MFLVKEIVQYSITSPPKVKTLSNQLKCTSSRAFQQYKEHGKRCGLRNLNMTNKTTFLLR
jgi:hypothetical protein